MPRSSTAARRLASADAPSTTSTAGLPAGRAATGRRAALGADFAVDLVMAFAARLGDDIKVLSFLHGLVLLQLHLAVRHALAGLHVVFHAVPGADEVHLGVREIHAHRGLVGAQPLLDLGDGQALAGRAALVQAEIAVGVELALVPEHADLVVADEHDAAVAVLELRKLCHEFFGHFVHYPRFTQAMAVVPCRRGPAHFAGVRLAARAMHLAQTAAPCDRPAHT